MDKISLLDCTLRDGGYINDFAFGKQTIIPSFPALQTRASKSWSAAF